MPSRAVILVLVLVPALVLPVPGQAAESKATARDVEHWVARLGSNQFAEREEATRVLGAIGEAALPALLQASRSGDLEVRCRALALVRAIEKQVETARLLRPLRVRLVFKDTPVATAVADFAQATGFPIQIEGNLDKLADRRVTLDTGETSFWEAFDQFCARAGVKVVAASEPDQPRRTFTSTTVIIRGGNVITSKDVTQPESAERMQTLAVGDGQTPSLPTCYVGALRIQALQRDMVLKGYVVGDMQTIVLLEISPEPRFQWQRLVGVRIHKAIDELGENLVPLVNVPRDRQIINQRGITVINGMLVGDDSNSEEVAREAPVRLRLASKASSKIRELNGTLTVQVRAPVQEFLAIDNLLKAEDRIVKGEAGTWIKVLEAARQDVGQFKVRFLVKAPASGVDDGTTAVLNRTVWVNGKVVGNKEEALSAQNFALLDAKGQPFQVVSATDTGKRSGAAQEFEILFQSQKGQADPARLLYRGRRSAVLEVPFTLKDVPLP